MKRFTAFLILVVMVLGALMPQAIMAQGPVAEKAPKPAQVSNAPVAPRPDWGGTWQFGPSTTFAFTRFDGEFYPGDGTVYFMGGRQAGTPDTDGSVWQFDPAAGTYADMGVDIVTPVSNFKMNLLQDDANDWGFYIFCGRPTGGGVTNAVQVYYPDTNTVVQLGPEDDFPGAGCTSALNVAYDNKVYVAGGFDPGQTPPNWDHTYIFDPAAAAGSRWTLIPSATLATARAYIMGAEVDGLIYAMGGNWYDGATLINMDTVEVLNPSDPTPTWTAVAVMPEQCSSSRAYGFSSDSPYLDPDATSLAGKIVSGCGFWPDENNHVYVYDAGLDYWEAFPYFAEANGRRDHAASFIPEGNGTGTPGMWVWGGRQDDDATFLQTSEYYELQVGGAECSVLLVDDDWGWGTDGGRPYYTSTLDLLGYGYDLWDTDSMGVPTATTVLSNYDVVVWFTGYDWQTPLDAAEEAEMTAYLDGGGNVLMSNQEQNYAFGLTPIMVDYFWVDSIADDVTLTGTVGNPADPLFGGFGPYTMDRPDFYYSYWPTGTSQGPYDDDAHVKAGGFEPMNYVDSGNPNSTRYEGANFKALYLGFPFEWIVDVSDRAEMLDEALQWFCVGGPTGFDLIPPSQAGSGIPGATATYTLTLLNNMGADETFTVTYSAVWPSDGPGVVGPVPNGDMESFIVTVTVPTDANCLDEDLLTVVAVAQSDPASEDTSYIGTFVTGGNVEGHVYDANTGLGIPDAYVEFILDVLDFETWTDADGYYNLGQVMPSCVYEGLYNAMGYFNASPYVAVESGVTVTIDIYLDAAIPNLSDSAVYADLPPDAVYTYTMMLSNTGSGDLHFHISELNDESPYPIPTGMPGGVDAQVYADLNASPDGTATFLVYMAEQADLDAAFGIEDWSVRGQYVLKTLQETAARSQAGLLAELNTAGVVYEPRYIVNAVQVVGDVNLVNSIAARSEVAFVGPNAKISAPEPVGIDPEVEGIEAVEWNINHVRAPDVWATGATGTGIVVASIDTGVDHDHEALTNQYRGTLGGGAFDHNYNWWDPYGYDPTVPFDWYGHGSHTVGTILGDDGANNQIGMAPDAAWFACQGFDKYLGWGTNVALLECAEFILAPWNLTGTNPMPDLRPHVVNNSWGGGQAQWWYNQAIYAWRAAGILGVFSAGNDGPACYTMGDPGDMINMMAVGATHTTDDLIAGFSSRGPANITGLTKPNVSAPGANIRSALPDDSYASWGGTSMAAPHVAGLAALLWSAQPELLGDVQLTYWVIEQSTVQLTTTEGCGGDTEFDIPNNTFGWGRIDAYEAVTLALSAAWDIPWLDVDPLMGVVAPSETVEIDLIFDSAGFTVGDCVSDVLKIEYNDPFVVEEFVPVELCVSQCVPVTNSLFIWTPVTPVVGALVTFDGSAGGSMPLAFAWDFGDGVGAMGEQVFHAYTAVGTYTVTMTATNPCGEEVVVDYVTVLAADIDPTPVPPMFAHPGDTMTELLPIGNVGNYTLTWALAEMPEVDWLDEAPTSGVVPPGGSTDVVLSYTVPMTTGVYTTVLVIDSNDPFEPEVYLDVELTVVDCISITDPSFGYAPVAPLVGEQVTFSGAVASGDEPITFTWDFGDGNVGVDQVVTHTYDVADTYVVVMTATNDCGEEVVTDTITIAEPPCEVITDVHMIVVTTGTIYPNDEVTFEVDLMPDDADPPFNYLVALGAVMTATEEPFFFTLTFGTVGTHTVDIEVWNCEMTVALTDTVVIVVEELPSPTWEIYLPLVTKAYAAP